MITILFIIGCLLTFLFLRKKRKIEKSQSKKGILYYFYANSLDFLVPFVVVAFFYLVLDLVISIAVASDSATLHFLIRFEEVLAKAKSFFSIFKLNAIQALIVLLGLYFLGFLRFPTEKSRMLFTVFDKYQIFFRRVYIVLVLLCSFTFFGAQLGESTKNVTLRIKTVRDGYADLCNEVQDTISEEVAHQLYSKVLDSFPQPYQDALELPTKIEQETNSLSVYYSSVRNDFGAKDRNVETLVDKGSLRARTASDLKVEVHDGLRNRIDYFTTPDPRQINYKKIEDAKSTVRQYRNKLRSRAIELLHIEGGKKVTFHIPKVFTGKFKKVFFEQIIKDYPILEPVVDMFSRTLDKQIEAKIESSIERIANSTIQNPESFDKSAVTQASTIASQKNIETTKSDLETARRTSIELRSQLTSIEKARTSLFRSISPQLSVELNTNLSVDISWSSVPDADSYRIYRSNNRIGSFNKGNSETTKSTSIREWPKVFPTRYRVTAIKGAIESKVSKSGKVELLTSKGGTACQLCGSKSIGYCHLRRIHVCSGHNVFTQRTGGRIRCP